MSNNHNDFKTVTFPDGLTSYFNDISRYRTLSKDEVSDLFSRYKEGDNDAHENILKHNLKFVVKIAKGYRNRGVEFEDLISEGNLGLIHAIDKYDPEKGVPFPSYAVWWIRNSMQEAIEKRNSSMLEVENGSDKYCEIFHDGDKINEDFEKKLDELQERNASVDALLECLQERERKIITLFYGLNGGQEMTLDEVSNRMNITIERVRQIKDKAMMKIKSTALALPEKEFEELKKMR